jgi:hypothetical protein
MLYYICTSLIHHTNSSSFDISPTLHVLLLREVLPFYIPSIFQSMIWDTNRESHYAYSAGCHVFHYHATPFSVDHDTLASVTVDITDLVLGGILGQSDFMDANNWIGGTANFFHNYWLNQDLDQPPSEALRNTNLYRSWVPNFQSCPPRPEIENRIHAARYDEQVTTHAIEQFNWYDGGGNHMDRNRHTLCVMPGNWLSDQYVCCQPHFYNKQVTDPLKTGGGILDAYQDIRRENEEQGHGHPGRVSDMEDDIGNISHQLSTGQYVDPEDVQVEGTLVML